MDYSAAIKKLIQSYFQALDERGTFAYSDQKSYAKADRKVEKILDSLEKSGVNLSEIRMLYVKHKRKK